MTENLFIKIYGLTDRQMDRQLDGQTGRWKK